MLLLRADTPHGPRRRRAHRHRLVRILVALGFIAGAVAVAAEPAAGVRLFA